LRSMEALVEIKKGTCSVCGRKDVDVLAEGDCCACFKCLFDAAWATGECSECGGKGIIERDIYGATVTSQCSSCDGTGRTKNSPDASGKCRG